MRGVVVVAMGACGALAGCGSDSCKVEPHPVFTHDITDPVRIAQAGIPWRSNNGEIKGHGNIRVTGPGNTAPIYAPIDAELIAGQGSMQGALSTGTNAPAAYLLVLRASCDVTIRIDHVHHPVQKVLDALGGGDGITSYRDISGVSFTAGELIGYAEDFTQEAPPRLSNFDFGVYNTAIPDEQFVNQKRYVDGKADTKLNADCPYAYFAVQSTYFGVLADDAGNLISDPELCLSRDDHDVAGTVSGAWFPASDNGASFGNDHLAIARESPALIKISGLVDMNIAGTTGPDPTTVTSEACYSDGNRYLYLHLDSPTALSAIVNTSTGTCPASFSAATGTQASLVR